MDSERLWALLINAKNAPVSMELWTLMGTADPSTEFEWAQGPSKHWLLYKLYPLRLALGAPNCGPRKKCPSPIPDSERLGAATGRENDARVFVGSNLVW